MSKIVGFTLFLALGLSCGKPDPGTAHEADLPYVGLLRANSCMEGQSYIIYQDKQFAVGSKSSQELRNAISNISQDAMTGVEPFSVSGCDRVYKIQFNGEFEEESSLTGYGNDETHDVAQVYYFTLI